MQLIKSRRNIKLLPTTSTVLHSFVHVRKHPKYTNCSNRCIIPIDIREANSFSTTDLTFFLLFYFVLIDVRLRRRHRIALINSNTQWKVIVCSIGRNTGIVDRRVSMLRREEAEIDVNSRCPTLRQKFVFRNGRAGSCWRRA